MSAENVAPLISANPTGVSLDHSVCTVASRRQVPLVRLLAQSLREHNPDRVLDVLLVDDMASGQPDDASAAELRKDDGIRLHDRSRLALPDARLRILALHYGADELALPLLPWFAEYFFSRGAQVVLYLHPETEVVAPLDPLLRHARKDGLVVWRRTLAQPLADVRRHPSDDEMIDDGLFDPGVIALTRWNELFVHHWKDRATRLSSTLRRWPDFAASFFGAGLALPAISPWCPEPPHPPMLARYPGFDPRQPSFAMPPGTDRPRVLLSEHPRLAGMYRARARSLTSFGALAPNEIGDGWRQLSDGWPLDARARRVYREALAETLLAAEEHRDTTEPPDAYLADRNAPATFRAWLRSDHVGGPPGISRYALDIYRHRLDLREAFPGLDNDESTRREFRRWLRAQASVEEGMPVELLPDDETRDSLAEQPVSDPAGRSTTDDVNNRHRNDVDPVGVADIGDPAIVVAGYLSAELGLAQAARQVVRAAVLSGAPVGTFTYRHTTSPQVHPWSDMALPHRASPILNVVCLNGPEMARFARTVGPSFFAGRRTAALWFWELDVISDDVLGGLSFVDELWVTSDQSRAAFAAVTDVPVFTVPLGFEATAPDPMLLRVDLSMPEGFVFGFSFDYHSRIERKNPLGLIASFRRAFAPGTGPSLVLKTINADDHVVDAERVRMAALDATADLECPDIVVIDGAWSQRRQATFMALCDAYVSLHRAEGYGLTLLEAMALGVPVIATDWPANREFMFAENSWLVRAGVVETPAGDGVYPAGATWAEPDLDAAAEAMREVYERSGLVAARVAKAREDVSQLQSGEPMAAFLRSRLAAFAASGRTTRQ